MKKPIIYQRVKPSIAASLHKKLESTLKLMDTVTLVKRSVYRGVSHKAFDTFEKFEHQSKTVWDKKGKKLLGPIHEVGCSISISKKIIHYKEKPLPGKEQVLMVIGDSSFGYMRIYDGDTVWVIKDLLDRPVILIKQNTEHKKKDKKTYYITVIRK